uniref:Secreted protein n=1 Tax=Mesocestoides corti TaxID=53468 RepID=A0A5K3EWM5_MESCO
MRYIKFIFGLTCTTVASDQGADILDHLAAANPVSLCVPLACEEDKQPTREGHG